MEKYQFVSKETENREKIWTKETWGMTICLFSSIVFLIMLVGPFILGKVGEGIVGFLLGSIGYFTFPLCALALLEGVLLVRERSLSIPLRYFALAFAGIYCIVGFIQTIMSVEYDTTSFVSFLSDTFAHGMGGYATAPIGGVLVALLTYPLLKYTTVIGGCLIFLVLTALAGFGIYYFAKKSNRVEVKKEEKAEEKKEEKAKEETQPVPHYTEEGIPVSGESVYTEQQVELPKSAPKPTIVRPVQDRNEKPAMEHSSAYVRSMNNIDQKINQILSQKDTNVPQYMSSSDLPDSDYQRRNDAFYEMASKVTHRSVRPDERKELFADHEPQGDYLPKPTSVNEGKAILYPSDEYAKNSYQKNLIFNGSSDFSNRKTSPRGVVGGYKPLNAFEGTDVDTGMPKKIVTEPTYFRQDNTPPRTVENVPYTRSVRNNGESFRPVPKEEPTERPDIFSRPTIEEYNRADSIRMERMERSADRPTPSFVPNPIATSEIRPYETKRVESEPIRPIDEVRRESEPTRIDRIETNRITPSAMEETRVDRVQTEQIQSPREDRTSRFEMTDRLRETREDRPTISSNDRAGSRSNPLSISSIFSSRSNDTGRTNIDMSNVSNRFVDRSPMRSKADLFDDDSAPEEVKEDRLDRRMPTERREVPEVRNIERREVPEIKREQIVERVAETPKKEEPVKKMLPYNRPPLDILEQYDETSATSEEEVLQNSEMIVSTLSDFRIESEVKKVTIGPTVTRYDIEIPRGIQAKKVAGYDEDLARGLRVRGVTIYPNFETGYVSIEVPNKRRSTVGLTSIMMSEQITKSKPTSLVFAMGKDVDGKAICGDVVKMTHLLVAGGTGSGKSVFLNEIIVSLIMKYSPEELRLILIDPKQVEFVVYKDLPHLMINEIVSDPTRVINILNWAIQEMERRYALFRDRLQFGNALVRNIDEYNASLNEGEQRLPKIVLIVDELADLMLRAKKEIEDRIQSLTQKARAAGIHLVIATQRPSVDVITGVIKSNLPTRVALFLASEVDSRTILDASGAEKLLGNGDMLYKTSEMPSPHRLQCSYVDSKEVQRVVEYIKENNEAVFDTSITEYLNNASRPDDGGEDGEVVDDGELDPVYIEALRYVVTIGQASISMIQRRCSVGYNRAGKIIEWMENMGYISPFEGAKARKVLLSKEEFEEKYGMEE